MKLKLVFVAIAAIVFAVMKVLARERAARAEAAGGCVACGSPKVHRDGDALRCADCGYSGRADGGGRLTRQEIDSLYDDRR